jgi:hypothetical protein
MWARFVSVAATIMLLVIFSPSAQMRTAATSKLESKGGITLDSGDASQRWN